MYNGKCNRQHHHSVRKHTHVHSVKNVWTEIDYQEVVVCSSFAFVKFTDYKLQFHYILSRLKSANTLSSQSCETCATTYKIPGWVHANSRKLLIEQRGHYLCGGVQTNATATEFFNDYNSGQKKITYWRIFNLVRVFQYIHVFSNTEITNWKLLGWLKFCK